MMEEIKAITTVVTIICFLWYELHLFLELRKDWRTQRKTFGEIMRILGLIILGFVPIVNFIMCILIQASLREDYDTKFYNDRL